jgi:hypothetical protein
MQYAQKIQEKLRVEQSQNCSGVIFNEQRIPWLKETHYLVEDYDLDGDAPKQFIRVYRYIRDGSVRKNKPKTWIPYIAKTGAKWYPHESVIEYLINRIGQVLGIEMNEVKLYRINDQIRFLSQYFLEQNETLIHGAEICGDYLEDRAFAEEIANDKTTARELFTFEFIEEAILDVFPTHGQDLLRKLVYILTFDAIVGNNDRHFYNWAVIRSLSKPGPPPRIAPVYDSSRGLFWNFDEEKISSFLRQTADPSFKKYFKYLEDACPRISIESDKAINHFKLISYLSSYNSVYENIVRSISSDQNEKKVIQLLDKEFKFLFSEDRYELTKMLLRKRFEIVRSQV